jgi:myo-inositol catabolism protein IolC
MTDDPLELYADELELVEEQGQITRLILRASRPASDGGAGGSVVVGRFAVPRSLFDDIARSWLNRDADGKASVWSDAENVGKPSNVIRGKFGHDIEPRE